MKTMKTKRILMLTAVLALSAVSLQSCKEDEEPKAEYIADDNSFKNFTSWTLEATKSGPDPALGAAHGGNDNTVERKIYFKDDQGPSGGNYPVGTLISKHSKNPDGTVDMITAMSKRGNDFNTSGGDWEWFILNADGSIAVDGDGNQLRGADLMGGACISCHAQASNKDYVFSK
jgi:hypothetical protein